MADARSAHVHVRVAGRDGAGNVGSRSPAVKATCRSLPGDELAARPPRGPGVRGAVRVRRQHEGLHAQGRLSRRSPFTGRANAVVAPKGPGRGSARSSSTASKWRQSTCTARSSRSTVVVRPVVVDPRGAYGEARGGRERRPPARRRRRDRDPALARATPSAARGTSSSRTAPAAAARGSSADVGRPAGRPRAS